MKAGLVTHIDAYEWISHKAYKSVAKKWGWLHKNHILTLLSKNRKDWLRYYKKWVSVEDEDEVSKKLEGKKWPSLLGPKAFIDRIKEKYGSKQINEEVPSTKELLPTTEQIIKIVSESYGVAYTGIKKKHRGQLNEARNAAIYLTRKLRRDTLKEIGNEFQIDKYSTVSSAIERMKKRISKDRELSRRLDKLTDSIKKSHEQI